MKNKVTRALEFASEAHGSINQKRKYPPEEDYIVHPIAVASIVSLVTDDEDIISAAYLHDVLEDVMPHKPNLYNIDIIEREFGKRVATFVYEMTNVFTPEAFPKFNRRKRKQLENERIATAYPETQTIKLADIIDNSKDMDKIGDFAKKYAEEKRDQLRFLSKGHIGLWERAFKILDVDKKSPWEDA